MADPPGQVDNPLSPRGLPDTAEKLEEFRGKVEASGRREAKTVTRKPDESEEVFKLRQQNANLRAQLKEFNHTLDEALSKRKQSQDSVKAQIDRLERALASQRKECRSLQTKLDERGSEFKLMERLATAESALTERDAEIKELRAECNVLKKQVRDPRVGNKANATAFDQSERIRLLVDELDTTKLANRTLQQQHAHDDRALQVAVERESRLKERLKALQDSVSTDQVVHRQSETMADKVEVAALTRVLEQEKQIKVLERRNEVNQRRAKDDIKEAKTQAAAFKAARDEMAQQLETITRMMKLAQLDAAEARRAMQAAQIETNSLRESHAATAPPGPAGEDSGALGGEDSQLSSTAPQGSAVARTPRPLRPSADNPSPYSARPPALVKEASGKRAPPLRLPMVKAAKGEPKGSGQHERAAVSGAKKGADGSPRKDSGPAKGGRRIPPGAKPPTATARAKANRSSDGDEEEPSPRGVGDAAGRNGGDKGAGGGDGEGEGGAHQQVSTGEGGEEGGDEGGDEEDADKFEE